MASSSLYVTYQSSFRVLAHQAALRAEWEDKTGQQKHQWRLAYTLVQDLLDQLEDREALVDRLRTNYERDLDDGSLQVESEAHLARYRERIEELGSQYVELAERYRNLASAWNSLGDVERAHPNPVDQSLEHVAHEIAGWTAHATRMDAAVRICEGLHTDPPVVRDGQGRRRMPLRWLNLGRAQMRFHGQIDDDVAIARLGIDPMDLEGDIGEEVNEDGQTEKQKGEAGGEMRKPEEVEHGEGDVNGIQNGIEDGADEDDWEDIESGSNESSELNGSNHEECEPPTDPDDKPERSPNIRWVPQHEIRGGMSRGHIWFKVDQNDQILDRLFRKDICLGREGWMEPLFWDRDIRDPNKMPMELAVTDAMAKVRNLHHSVRMRVDPDSSHVSYKSLAYRMYLQYAPFGDLQHLIAEHHQSMRRIPEPFIWYVAYAAANAGVAMAKGSLVGSDKKEWKEIVHRDLKPANIFLDGNLASIYASFATPVIGDYGIVIRTDDNDVLNPFFYRLTGTPGFLAPEQYEQVNRDDLTTIDDHRLSEKTNVYGIGLILWCLILNATNPPEPIWVGDPDKDGMLDIDDPVGFWSDELKEMISLCLNYDPDNRPTFEELLVYIDEATQAPFDRSLGMRDGIASQAVIDANMPLYGPERYTLFTVRPAI